MSCVIDGRSAVVTGSSRGLGKAIALELAGHGARVVINYLNSRQEAEHLRDEIRDLSGEAICSQADVAEEGEAKRLIDAAVEEFGGIDILVNNAGINRERLLRLMKSEDWHDVLKTNLDSVFHCTHAAARYMMKQRRGHIINIASAIGQMGNIGQANYAAAKAGIIGFTKAVALEFARYNITVNAVCPGFIETEMVGKMEEAAQGAVLERIPLGRFGQPEEVARLCRFLVTEGDYITGAQLNINGGLYLQ